MTNPIAPIEPTDEQIDALHKGALMDKKSKREFARAVLALAPARQKSAPAPVAQEPVAWRCFHCDAVYADREQARQHFGLPGEQSEPFCKTTLGRLLVARAAALKAAQGLSDAEIERIYTRYGGDMMNCARAIERAILSANRAAQETKT